MFRYLRIFSVFCTIIITVFIVGASGFRFGAIVIEPVSSNLYAQDNSAEAVLKSEKLNTQAQQRGAIVQGRSLPPIPAPVSYASRQPTQPQQNFRYIVPAVMQKTTENQTVDTLPNQTTPNRPTPVTEKPPTLLPAPLPQPADIDTANQLPLSANAAPLPATNPQQSTETNTRNPSNPFEYRGQDGEGIGLIPRNISSLPAGIQVIGIMILNDKKSIAAIRIPRTAPLQRNTQSNATTDVFYVQENDIIEVPTGNLTTNRSNTSTRGTINPSNEILFLIVEKITSQHVEVRSRSNIADKHILR
ncbi:MAG: hypothetical protein LBK06_05390 [Planctomycetaceae bacterium]|jgi:hypothetical protein|nr:hypothetical protein [Planctomycetaceae bacterium]